MVCFRIFLSAYCRGCGLPIRWRCTEVALHIAWQRGCPSAGCMNPKSRSAIDGVSAPPHAREAVSDSFLVGYVMQQHAQAKTEVLAQMGIKRGSRIIPFLLLILVAILFVVLSFQEGEKQLIANLGLENEARILDAKYLDKKNLTAEEKATQEAEIKEVIKKVSEKATDAIQRRDWDFLVRKFLLPAAKTYLDQLVGDFWSITKTIFHATWQLVLYALIPGIAGLIYRRRFWAWFLISLATLLVIDASGLFGSLFGGESLPRTGWVFFFVVFNLVLLLLAHRLRRHSSGATRMPAWLHNGLLIVALLLFALAWIKGWGPWSAETNAWMWSFLPTRFLYKWETILVGLPILYVLLRKSTYWPGASPKNIVVCIDGTNNTPDQVELGLLAQTNVFKLFKMLKADKQPTIADTAHFDASLSKRYANRQMAFYYTGVGNKFDNDPIVQTLGLAAGAGASGIVQRAYLDITRVYRPGDRIFIFGFSRGAAIARLLARTIDSRGAPRTLWTLRLFGRHWMVWKSASKQHDVPICVLGCWDTVGSFGIAKTIAGINFQQLNLFKDLSVPDNVQQAYHLVALDEMRDSFEPTLMEPDPITPHRIIEVWFSGDHANVGGGWATDKLSDVTLDFLLRQLSSGYASDDATQAGDETWGLYLKAVNGDKVSAANQTDAVVIHPDHLGQLRQVSSGLYKYAPRKLPLHAVISETVFARMTKSLPVYAPQSLFNHNEDLDKKRGTIDTQVARLVETHSLSASEQGAILEFKDKLRLTRWPQYLEQLRLAGSSDEQPKRLANESFAAAPAI